jgi:Icc-related predicted phosphoesterase
MEDRTQTIMVGCTYFSNAFERSLASLRAVMSEIPEQLDVLMTHTPPFPHMAKRLAEMEQPPHVHCFGHDHREAKIAFHSIGKPLVLDAGLRLRRRFYVNAAQEKMLSQEWLCGGAAWVFDLQARESDQPF